MDGAAEIDHWRNVFVNMDTWAVVRCSLDVQPYFDPVSPSKKYACGLNVISGRDMADKLELHAI